MVSSKIEKKRYVTNLTFSIVRGILINKDSVYRGLTVVGLPRHAKSDLLVSSEKNTFLRETAEPYQ